MKMRMSAMGLLLACVCALASCEEKKEEVKSKRADDLGSGVSLKPVVDVPAARVVSESDRVAVSAFLDSLVKSTEEAASINIQQGSRTAVTLSPQEREKLVQILKGIEMSAVGLSKKRSEKETPTTQAKEMTRPWVAPNFFIHATNAEGGPLYRMVIYVSPKLYSDPKSEDYWNVMHIESRVILPDGYDWGWVEAKEISKFCSGFM